jgi:hypothetical protein
MALILGRTTRSNGPARTGLAFLVPLVSAGVLLVAVGLVDLSMVWLPFHFGQGEWELVAASRTFDALSLVTMGLTFVTTGAIARDEAPGLRGISLFLALVLSVLIGVYVLFLLNAPVALRHTPPAGAPVLRQSILRTSCFAVFYVAFYGWLSWFTWRRAGAAKKGATG